jgi:hypothetical protein
MAFPVAGNARMAFRRPDRLKGAGLTFSTSLAGDG